MPTNIENVVYILGAGFSQPLGIPTISEFLGKANDLLESGDTRYAYFEHVFERISELAKAKSYYAVDVENVEETLSMLEMMEYAGPSPARVEVQRFIRDVIEAFTPEIVTNPKAASEPMIDSVFGNGYLAKHYGLFVAGLCGFSVAGKPGYKLAIEPVETLPARYTVVSLNYDCALESAYDFLRDNWMAPPSWGFAVYPLRATPMEGRCVLAKLHGSVRDGPEGIVPPTWNKGRRDHIAGAWRQAYLALSRANRIRIIGYSLPENDAYFRYLLKAAATNSRNLKSVHVLCQDNGRVEERYAAFVDERKLSFKSAPTLQYLGALPETTKVEINRETAMERLTANLEANHIRTFGKL